MTVTREQPFLARIKSALKIPKKDNRRFSTIFPSQNEKEIQVLANRVEARDEEIQQKLLDQLIDAGKQINLKVLPIPDIATATPTIADIVKNKEPEWGQEKHIAVWRQPLIDQLNLSHALADENIAIHPTTFPDEISQAEGRQQIREEIIASFIGITSADYCVAESATMVMKTRLGQARAASLVPAIHIAIIRIDQIIANLNELYTLLKQEPDFNRQSLTNCLTFISGPSKTADIEAVMVHGAHGPREVYLLVVTDKSQ